MAKSRKESLSAARWAGGEPQSRQILLYSGQPLLVVTGSMLDVLTILAPGLLGASLAMAVKAHSLAARVQVWSRKVESRLEAARQAWCDAVYETPEAAVQNADLVVVCSPVETIVPLVERIAAYLAPQTIVTDVGSTKSLICRHAHRAMREDTAFIGSHPMAGSEKSGMHHAAATLFRQRCCFVTPLLDTPESAVETVVRFWRELDMQVTTISPEAHDEIVAHISHLPHLLASVLCLHLAKRDEKWAAFSGPGLADTTRVAAGNASLWQAILQQNREEVLRAISQFENQLHQFKSALANEDYIQVRHQLELGRAFRSQLRAAE